MPGNTTQTKKVIWQQAELPLQLCCTTSVMYALSEIYICNWQRNKPNDFAAKNAIFCSSKVQISSKFFPKIPNFASQKYHFLFVKKCKFGRSHQISSKNQYLHHNHQFSSFCEFFVKKEILWSLLIVSICHGGGAGLTTWQFGWGFTLSWWSATQSNTLDPEMFLLYGIWFCQTV